MDKRARRKHIVNCFKNWGCRKCGKLPSATSPLESFHCDHIYGPKVDNISNLLDGDSAVFMLEMLKVQPLCSDCHAIKTKEDAGKSPPLPDLDIDDLSKDQKKLLTRMLVILAVKKKTKRKSISEVCGPSSTATKEASADTSSGTGPTSPSTTAPEQG